MNTWLSDPPKRKDPTVNTNPEHPAPLVYSVNDSMRISSIGRTKLYALINQGMLDTIKIGRRTLVKAASLHKLIETGT